MTHTLYAALNFSNFLRDTDWLSVLFIIISALVLLWFARRMVDDFVTQALRHHRYSSATERQKRIDTLSGIFTTIITIFILTVAAILLMVEFGVNLTAAAASAGALGVVLGIAFQSILADVTRGMSIILDNQMRIKDIVTVAGVSGVVEDISLRYSRLRDLDGNLHIVPNGEIVVVTNHSSGSSNVNLDVSVSYDSDMDKVVRVINQIGETMHEEKAWQESIVKPISFLRVDSFGESGVNIKALGEVLPGEQWAVAGEFRKRLLVAFEKEGIEIPFPQRVVHTSAPAEKPKRSS